MFVEETEIDWLNSISAKFVELEDCRQVQHMSMLYRLVEHVKHEGCRYCVWQMEHIYT